MPVLINEIVAEVEPSASSQTQSPAESQSPVSDPEYTLLKMWALMEERKARLLID